MPNHEDHCAESLKRYGKTFSEMHSWMDEPSLLLGSSHRRYRHDPSVTPIEAKIIFGFNADNACLDHIRLDALESQRSIMTFWIPNNIHNEIRSVQPVVSFTINSYAGAWHFQSEAISISENGKTHFCFRSSVEEEDDDNDDNDEDEEWEEEDPDNPETSEP